MKRGLSKAVAAMLAFALTLGGARFALGAENESGSRADGPAAADFLLTPTQADKAGIQPTASFQLASAMPLTLAEVQERLSVTPAVDLTYTQADGEGRLFAVKPVLALESDRVYTFRLATAGGTGRPYQWSFQTQPRFRVLGSLPRHESTSVPVKTPIEVTFSHETYGNVEPFFTISPEVKGHFERRKKTVAFIPWAPLLPGTVYTVTLKPGLALNGAGVALEAPFRFSFETAPAGVPGRPRSNLISIDRAMKQFLTGEPPVFQVYAGGWTSLGVSVFRYQDAAQLIGALEQADRVPWWASYNSDLLREETAGLSRVASFEAVLKSKNERSTPNYLHFPEPLPAGYYLAELKVGEHMRQVRFQVTDLTAYLAATTDTSLLWVHNVRSGTPVEGAEVTHPGGTALTGAGGVAQFETPGFDRSAGLHLRLQGGGQEAVVSAWSDGPWDAYSHFGRDGWLVGYWKYLYLDRPLFQPEDTVQFFGVVQPRDPGAVPADRVTALVMRQEYSWPGSSEPPPLVAAEFPVDDGVFSGALSLPNLKPGWYELQIRSGTQHVMSSWFEVQTFTKPPYRFSLSGDRRAIFDDETVTFKVRATYFEGTPLPNLALNYRFRWHTEQQGVVTTGPDGTASVTIAPGRPTDDSDTSLNSGATFSIWASLPEVGQINAETGVSIFSRSAIIMTEPVDVARRTTAVIPAQVSYVNLEKMNAGKWDYFGAPAAGMKVQGTLIGVRRNAGVWREEAVGRFTAVTDAEGKIAQQVELDPAIDYRRFELEVLDTKGRTVRNGRNFVIRQFDFPSDSTSGPYKHYRLEPEDPEKRAWATDEEVALRLLETKAPPPDRSAGYLFLQARQGLKEYRVQETATYRFAFRESDLPHTTVRGVYFDGRHYHETSPFEVRFDSSQRKLKVVVTPDRSIYRPGETVNLTVRVTDRNDKPVRAHVNLNLVDVALLALRGQQSDILGALYKEHVLSGILMTRRARLYIERYEPSGGKQAYSAMTSGGIPATRTDSSTGEREVRQDFQDTSYFGTVVTDASGEAVASFRLPDNLTTWRMTYQAFAPGMAGAATGTSTIAVKIPFFVDPVFSDVYLSGDRPVVTVRSFGTELAAGQPVSYEVRVTGPNGTQVTTLDGEAFIPVSIPVDAGTPGTYTVRVQASTSGELQDTLEKQFTVIESYLRQQKVDYHVLGRETTLTGPSDGLVSLLFTDHERGRYMRLLNEVRGQRGNRLEQKLARTVAAGLLKTYFGAQGRPEPEWDSRAFQAPDGSIDTLPYGDGDLYLSALAADLARDRFDPLALAAYFVRVLEDHQEDRDRVITALYGLAALGHPVLLQVRELMGVEDLTPSERLRLALAAAALGDLEGARPAYRELIRRHGEKLGGSLRIAAGHDHEEILSAAALTAVLAARLGEPETAALLEYVMENRRPRGALFLLEQLLAARVALPSLRPEPAVFSYTQDGLEALVELKPGQPLQWTVTAARLNRMRFSTEQGQVGVTVSYEAPLSPEELRQEPGYAVIRTYSVEGKGAGTTWQQGDLVRVSLTYRIPETAPGTGFELTDFLPSGLRLVQQHWSYGMREQYAERRPLSVNGQQVTFSASWGSGEIYYYARVISPGQYSSEEPVLYHQKSGVIFSHGERTQITIEH